MRGRPITLQGAEWIGHQVDELNSHSFDGNLGLWRNEGGSLIVKEGRLPSTTKTATQEGIDQIERATRTKITESREGIDQSERVS